MNIYLKLRYIKHYLLQKIIKIYFFVNKNNLNYFLTLIYFAAYVFFLGTLNAHFPKIFKIPKKIKKTIFYYCLTNSKTSVLYTFFIIIIPRIEKKWPNLKLPFILKFNIALLAFLELLIYLFISWFELFFGKHKNLSFSFRGVKNIISALFLTISFLFYSTIFIYSYFCCLFNLYPEIPFLTQSAIMWAITNKEKVFKI